MTMHVIRHADCRPTPWKNGGGVTTEIIAWPPAAGFDEFDWRISMAQVAAGGPFSVFPGIDRTLTVLEGVMRLEAGDAAPAVLDPQSGPYAFPGDVATAATLIEGPVLDFNVMTRRGRFGHEVRRLQLAAPGELAIESGACLVFVEAGAANVANGAGSIRIGRFDALHVEGPAVLAIEPAERARILQVTIAPS
ncbi:environmental stress-induced protein Ves [Aminobacter sp. BE322]